jgi:signal transduction histidine kinase
MSARANLVAETDAAELVFAMCHEVSNLVTAVRLQAHLLDEDLDARGLAVASLEIDDLSARTASLLALIRPVLSPPPGEIPPVASGVIALGFKRALTEHGERGLEIVYETEPDLPDVRAEPDVFHYLLLSHVYGAMEATDNGGQIRIEVTAGEKEVIFAVEDQAPADEQHLSWWKSSLRGRVLESAVAHHILSKRGARFDVKRIGTWTRTEIAAPRV